MRRALITGVGGQDGSYLSEHLISLGYEVHGIIRRQSVAENQDARVKHLEGIAQFHYGDLLDVFSLQRVMRLVMPDEIYNLSAMSHVRISFDIPSFTIQTNALGVLNMLEVWRQVCPSAHFYQASSSEMFGSSVDEDGYQRETTPMHPTSPYGCAKVLGFNLVRHYRAAYGLFAANGVLFNHETMVEQSPVIARKDGSPAIDVLPICDAVDFVNRAQATYQSAEVHGLQVWGGSGWTRVKYASAYPHDLVGDNKHPRHVNARCGIYMATGSHVVFLAKGEERATSDLRCGDHMETVALPETGGHPSSISEEEAEMLGMMVADGSVSYKQGASLWLVHAKFTKRSSQLRDRFALLWHSVSGGSVTPYCSPNPGELAPAVPQLALTGAPDYLRGLDLYTSHRHKRIPKRVLNASHEAQLAFLRGYNACDGLKKGHGRYEFKSWKTNSPTLAMGLWLLADNVLPTQQKNVNLEFPKEGSLGPGPYYMINLHAPRVVGEKERVVLDLLSQGVSQREIERRTGISRTFVRKIARGGHESVLRGLELPFTEIKKIVDVPEYSGWFYDLETESGEFVAGIGNIHVHNSPRRGANFVTRKVVKGAVAIKLGRQKNLRLGNLDSFRDWGHAADYVKAMHLILNHEKPDDFVVATGETHSVRQMCEYVFKRLGLDYNDHVAIDGKFVRPQELSYLRGDSSKARRTLGWEPSYTFEQLMDEMVDAELAYQKSHEG